jgi:metal-responsive CopG/Arc/MetJ family transcriptional regulator
MAKVMVSIPDELLASLDAQARRRGTTRSGILRQLVEREIASTSDVRSRTIAELLAEAGSHGGDNARHVRELRRSR